MEKVDKIISDMKMLSPYERKDLVDALLADPSAIDITSRIKDLELELSELEDDKDALETRIEALKEKVVKDMEQAKEVAVNE